uniref:Uncharacterized protein n=1 Tax=Physcomitrium patens TaxID=3218 RepID=A0A2K1JQI0_PHYPA|nr:hypothetical protein PHYPA_016180 [Physcomitrium patens]
MLSQMVINERGPVFDVEVGSMSFRKDLAPGSLQGDVAGASKWGFIALLIAQLRIFPGAAPGRGEMHTHIGIQRDNKSKLRQITVATSIVPAARLAAINGDILAQSLSATAIALNLGTTQLMLLASTFQPSQLVGNQCCTACQFQGMVDDIEATVGIDPDFRESAHLYLEDKIDWIYDADNAFPLPSGSQVVMPSIE